MEMSRRLVLASGATLVEFDLEPFYETARLLYEGPWVAERYLVIRDLLASSPDSIHPVTREITAPGARLTAADTFASLYRLQALRRTAERIFAGLDAMVLPTAPTAYSTAQVLANPIELNSRLGTYTNFVNLLDLCGLALPAAMRADGIPFGITLLAPAGHDASLASIGRVFGLYCIHVLTNWIRSRVPRPFATACFRQPSRLSSCRSTFCTRPTPALPETCGAAPVAVSLPAPDDGPSPAARAAS